MLGPATQGVCRGCRGACIVTVKGDDGKDKKVPCPACNGTGKQIYRVK